MYRGNELEKTLIQSLKGFNNDYLIIFKSQRNLFI